HAQMMDFHRSEDISKCLGWIGLAALNEGLTDTTASALGNLTSVTKAAAQKIPNVGSRDLARLLMPLRLMGELATRIDNEQALHQIHNAEAKLLKEMSSLADLKAALDKEERAWLDRLDRRGKQRWMTDPNGPEALFVQIIQRRASQNA